MTYDRCLLVVREGEDDRHRLFDSLDRFRGKGNSEMAEFLSQLIIEDRSCDTRNRVSGLTMSLLLLAFELAPPAAAAIQIFRPSCSNPTLTNECRKMCVRIGLFAALQWLHKEHKVQNLRRYPCLPRWSFRFKCPSSESPSSSDSNAYLSMAEFKYGAAPWRSQHFCVRDRPAPTGMQTAIKECTHAMPITPPRSWKKVKRDVAWGMS
jgi:hypothetical protein